MAPNDFLRPVPGERAGYPRPDLASSRNRFFATLRIDRDRCAEYTALPESPRSDVRPPVDVAGMPAFKGSQNAAILVRPTCSGSWLSSRRRRCHGLFCVSIPPLLCAPGINFRLRPCRSVREAPVSPTAFGRWKIQFCHAVRRPKIWSHGLRTAEARLASRPVKPSGEKLARSSRNTRISSSQSISSSAKATRPSRSPAAASSASPARYKRARRIGIVEVGSKPAQPIRHRKCLARLT